MRRTDEKTIAILYFSTRGENVALKIHDGLVGIYSVSTFRCPSKGLFKTTKMLWDNFESIIFISSTGIAVRAIASNIESKLSDPAVLVIDEKENFVISLLSGHFGGANALTSLISKKFDIESVITTATDVNNVFSFDTFANLNNLTMENQEKIKTIARMMIDMKENNLDGSIEVYSLYNIDGILPQYLSLSDSSNSDVFISNKKFSNDSLYLIPSNLVLGIGCRVDTTYQEIENAFIKFMSSNLFFEKSIMAICSIDLKKNERGLNEFCRNRKIDFFTYSKKQLENIVTSSSSEFVKKTTGVGCVCESSALYHSSLISSNRLIKEKTIVDHITFALCEVDLKLNWTKGNLDE